MGTLDVIPSVAAVKVVFASTDIPGSVGWYEFADATTLFTDTGRTTPVASDGDLIKGIADKSGGGRHLSEGTNPPTWKTAILNTRSVGRFDGSSNVLTSAAAAFAFGTGATVIAVTKQTTAPGSRYVVSGDGDHLMITNGANGQIVWGGSQNVGYSLIQSANFLAGSFGIVAGTFDTTLAAASEVNAWRNGTAFTTRTSSQENTGNVLATQMSLGATPTPGSFWNGDIAEVLIYNAVCSSANLNYIGNYLAAKYALTWAAI